MQSSQSRRQWKLRRRSRRLRQNPKKRRKVGPTAHQPPPPHRIAKKVRRQISFVESCMPVCTGRWGLSECICTVNFELKLCICRHQYAICFWILIIIVRPVFKPEELRQALMPTLEALYRQDPESLPFRQPVDPKLLGIPVSICDYTVCIP